MHCLAGLDSASDGQSLHRRHRTHQTVRQGPAKASPREDWVRIPEFQSRTDSDCPREHHPSDRYHAGKVDREWFDTVVDTVGLRDRLATSPPNCPEGNSSASHVPRALASRPAIVFAGRTDRQSRFHEQNRVLGFLRKGVDDFGQTIVMVTHDPNAASYADRVIFLADGRIVDEIRDPTADSVLDCMKRFETIGFSRPTSPGSRDQRPSNSSHNRQAAGMRASTAAPKLNQLDRRRCLDLLAQAQSRALRHDARRDASGAPLSTSSSSRMMSSSARFLAHVLTMLSPIPWWRLKPIGLAMTGCVGGGVQIRGIAREVTDAVRLLARPLGCATWRCQVYPAVPADLNH